MTRHVVMQWNLRQVMATRGMFATSDLVPLLAERGVHLSREHVYRLVTRTCLLYTSPSPRDGLLSRMPSSA